jgi:hypothetical protein
MVIATEYMGIPTLVQGSLIWTLRHPFVNQGRLNQEVIQLGYQPGEMDLCPVGSIGPDDPYLLVMADYGNDVSRETIRESGILNG